MSFPSFTKTTHHKSYPAISPTRTELSCRDKIVIITGGGQGIGATTALSFAKAGAAKIALVGRTESKLADTKSKIQAEHANIEIYLAVTDTSDAEAFGRAAHDIRDSLGAWDVFVHCAGVAGDVVPLAASDIDDWWSVFEINTKVIAIFAKHFLTKCRMPGATFVCINAAAAHLPVDNFPAVSAYSASKAATARLCEFLAKEKPQLRVFSVHPGIIKTPMSDKFLATANPEFATKQVFDEPELAADFFVWCASPEAEFVRGRYLWANWDVEEMQQKKTELESDPGLLRLQIGGWPFAQ